VTGTCTCCLARKAVGEELLPVIRLHDLRHTHATLLLAAGEPVKVVSERLGHASATITLTVCQHVYPGMGGRRPTASLRCSTADDRPRAAKYHGRSAEGALACTSSSSSGWRQVVPAVLPARRGTASC